MFLLHLLKNTDKSQGVKASRYTLLCVLPGNAANSSKKLTGKNLVGVFWLPFFLKGFGEWIAISAIEECCLWEGAGLGAES